MPNTLLTDQVITRKALKILHQKLTFISNIERQYDDRFAKSGAKIGDTLSIRLPNQYTVRTGMAMSTQDVTEQKVDLVVSNVKGVDLEFGSLELALDIDDFSERIIEPAMSSLAAAIEADACQMWLDVPNVVDGSGSAMTFARLMQARKQLNDNLAPQDRNRNLILNTQDNVDLVNELKGLFNAQETISNQNVEGAMGRHAGFNMFESTIGGGHTSGTALATTAYLMNGTTTTGASTLVVDGGTTTFKKGDVITIANVFAVHPETKATLTGVLRQFVVTADVGTSATAIPVSPPLYSSASGGLQNVSAMPADNAAISKLGGAANAVYKPSLAFHKSAFVFATADLPLPKGTDMAYREVYDGISMSLVRDFDVSSRDFPCRLDVLYGFKAVRPQLATRILSN